MKKSFTLFLLCLHFIYPASAQHRQNSVDNCKSFDAVIRFLENWRKSSTEPNQYPLNGPLAHGRIPQNFYTRQPQVYDSKVKFNQEFLGEFAIGEGGQCSYDCLIGPFTAPVLSKKGQILKKDILECINRTKWLVGQQKDVFLLMSYKPVDITVTLMKYPTKDLQKQYLRLSMFRFTPKE